MEAIIAQARQDLAAALRMAAWYGLNEGVCNHFSYALPGMEDRFLLNPHGIHWSRIKASDILLIDSEGRTIDGKTEAELTAFIIHSRIHANNPKARCVMHTHMPYATALANLEDPTLLPLSQQSLRSWGEVAYDMDYNGLAEDREEGDRIARALGDKKVLFMANHGVTVVGETIPETFDWLYYLEQAARLQVLAYSTGRPLKVLGDNMAGKTKAEYDRGGAYFQAHFEAMKELIGEDYKD